MRAARVPRLDRGRFAIRACFINPRSTLAHADATVDEVLKVARAQGAIG